MDRDREKAGRRTGVKKDRHAWSGGVLLVLRTTKMIVGTEEEEERKRKRKRSMLKKRGRVEEKIEKREGAREMTAEIQKSGIID